MEVWICPISCRKWGQEVPDCRHTFQAGSRGLALNGASAMPKCPFEMLLSTKETWLFLRWGRSLLDVRVAEHILAQPFFTSVSITQWAPFNKVAQLPRCYISLSRLRNVLDVKCTIRISIIVLVSKNKMLLLWYCSFWRQTYWDQ